MIELITVAVFVWLMCKAVGLAFKLTWGIAKVAASILMILATPILILSLLFAGGIALMLPILLIGIAVGILNASS